jgi:hypothetical protein
MRVDFKDARIFEQLQQPFLGPALHGRNGICHHARRIEAAKGQRAGEEHRREIILETSWRHNAFTHEDGVAGAKGLALLAAERLIRIAVSPGSASSSVTRQGEPGLLVTA